jgi:hypothetical protein
MVSRKMKKNKKEMNMEDKMGIGVKVYREDRFYGYSVRTITSETPKYWVCKFKNSVGNEDEIKINKSNGKEYGSGGNTFGSSYWHVLTEEKREEFVQIKIKNKIKNFVIDISKVNKENQEEVINFINKYGVEQKGEK